MKTYSAYKESGIEWLGAIPTHWSTARMRMVIDSVLNGVWGNEPQGDENDLVCVRVADFDMLTLGVSRDKLTTRNIPQNQQGERLLIKDNLLIEKSGGGDISPVGRVIRFDLDEKAVCSNFVGKVSVNKKKVLPSFLLYYTTNLYNKAVNTRSIKQTTGIQNLDTYSYFSEQISIPSLSEQQAIANFLDCKTAQIDTLIAKKQRQIDLLQEQRTALINQAVTKGLNPSAPMKDSGVEWLGEIPGHWQMVRLRHISPSISVGLVIQPTQYVDPKGTVPFLYGSNIRENSFLLEDVRKITPESNQKIAASMLHTGDLVTVRVGYPGVTAIIPEYLDGANCTSMMIVRKSNFVLSEYLCYSMNSRIGMYQVESVEYGAAQKQFNISHAVDFVYPIPPINEQTEIVTYLDEKSQIIRRLANDIQQQIEKLQEYRTALISEAVTGKIDVRTEKP